MKLKREQRKISEQGFWEFSLRHYVCQSQLMVNNEYKTPLYKPNEVTVNKDILLRLQDNYAYNVNLVLAILYTALRGKILSEAQAKRVKKSLVPLDLATQILRQKRLALADNRTANEQAKENLAYKQALKKEIESEQVQQVFIIAECRILFEEAKPSLNKIESEELILTTSLILQSLLGLHVSADAAKNNHISNNEETLRALLLSLIERVVIHERQYLLHTNRDPIVGVNKNAESDESHDS